MSAFTAVLKAGTVTVHQTPPDYSLTIRRLVLDVGGGDCAVRIRISEEEGEKGDSFVVAHLNLERFPQQQVDLVLAPSTTFELELVQTSKSSPGPVHVLGFYDLTASAYERIRASLMADGLEDEDFEEEEDEEDEDEDEEDEEEDEEEEEEEEDEEEEKKPKKKGVSGKAEEEEEDSSDSDEEEEEDEDLANFDENDDKEWSMEDAKKVMKGLIEHEMVSNLKKNKKSGLEGSDIGMLAAFMQAQTAGALRDHGIDPNGELAETDEDDSDYVEAEEEEGEKADDDFEEEEEEDEEDEEEEDDEPTSLHQLAAAHMRRLPTTPPSAGTKRSRAESHEKPGEHTKGPSPSNLKKKPRGENEPPRRVSFENIPPSDGHKKQKRNKKKKSKKGRK